MSLKRREGDTLIYKGLGSLTTYVQGNNFCPVNFKKFILQRTSKNYNVYKIKLESNLL